MSASPRLYAARFIVRRTKRAAPELDRFLRDIWLECCGHLSAFKIAGTSFASTVDKSGWGLDDERTMAAKIRGLVDVPS